MEVLTLSLEVMNFNFEIANLNYDSELKPQTKPNKIPMLRISLGCVRMIFHPFSNDQGCLRPAKINNLGIKHKTKNSICIVKYPWNY